MCGSDRRFGECVCTGDFDSGMVERDAGQVVPMDDAQVIIPMDDAQVIIPSEDAGVDAFVPPTGCSPACSSSERCCGDICVNRGVAMGTDGRDDESFYSCGACGLECDPSRASACSGTTPHCMCGATSPCVAPRTCESTTSGFACLDLNNDAMNCGTPGHRCATGQTCSMGSCVGGTTTCGGVTCPTGRMCCDGVCIDTTNNIMHCGACNAPCGPTADRCSSSTCHCGTGAACMAGLPFPGGGMPGQLCCATRCVAQDTSNCSMCGDRCLTGEVCGLDFGGSSGICCGTEVIPGAGIVTCGL